MKVTFIILIFCIGCSLATFGQICPELRDGKNQFVHENNSPFRQNFTLIKDGNKYYLAHDDRLKRKIKVVWFNNCLFTFDDNIIQTNQVTDSTNSVQVALSSLGNICIELLENNKFRSTYCGNLHITLSNGTVYNNR